MAQIEPTWKKCLNLKNKIVKIRIRSAMFSLAGTATVVIFSTQNTALMGASNKLTIADVTVNNRGESHESSLSTGRCGNHWVIAYGKINFSSPSTNTHVSIVCYFACIVCCFSLCVLLLPCVDSCCV